MLIRELDKIVNQTLTRSILENQSSEQYDAILKDLLQNDIKIIIGIFDISTTVKLFCKIYKNNMYGSNYQWIILGTYNRELLLAQNETECTVQELLIALNGTLQTRVVQYSYEYEIKMNSVNRPKNRYSVLKTVYEDGAKMINFMEKQFSNIVEAYMANFTKISKSNGFEMKKNCLNSYFHGYSFDVLLTIFKTFSNLIEDGKFSCLDLEFKRDIDWFAILNNALKKISFKGVTVITNFWF